MNHVGLVMVTESGRHCMHQQVEERCGVQYDTHQRELTDWVVFIYPVF
jgi:hypothetical protein